jgi:uncharacterized membrane protein YvlD (DUF360 family)
MKAKLFSLSAKDFVKGLFLAVITAIVTFMANELQIGSSVDVALLKRIGVTAVIAFLSYLGKQLLTNSKDEILTAEPPKPPTT